MHLWLNEAVKAGSVAIGGCYYEVNPNDSMSYTLTIDVAYVDLTIGILNRFGITPKSIFFFDRFRPDPELWSIRKFRPTTPFFRGEKPY